MATKVENFTVVIRTNSRSYEHASLVKSSDSYLVFREISPNPLDGVVGMRRAICEICPDKNTMLRSLVEKGIQVEDGSKLNTSRVESQIIYCMDCSGKKSSDTKSKSN